VTRTIELLASSVTHQLSSGPRASSWGLEVPSIGAKAVKSPRSSADAEIELNAAAHMMSASNAPKNFRMLSPLICSA
jgi:hypothetical protein